MTPECPWCGHRGQRTRNASRRPRRPDQSMVVFCPTCGEFSMHTGVGTLRRPTIAEGAAIYATPEAQFVQGQWRQRQAGHPTPLFPKPTPSQESES